MNAKELQKENERLKKELEETRAQHQAVAEQFTQTLVEKDQRVALLEHQLKLLMQRIKGSRQERINPDQLLLFSLDDLKQMIEQLDQGSPDEDLIDDQPKLGRRRPKRGRIGPLPNTLNVRSFATSYRSRSEPAHVVANHARRLASSRANSWSLSQHG